MKKINKLRIPVTRGLKDIYAMDMHLAYQVACAGQFNVTAFGRLAAAISVVRSALDQKHTKIPLAIETLDAAIVTLLAVRHRGDETDQWEITESERPAVSQRYRHGGRMHRHARCRTARTNRRNAAAGPL